MLDDSASSGDTPSIRRRLRTHRRAVPRGGHRAADVRPAGRPDEDPGRVRDALADVDPTRPTRSTCSGSTGTTTPRRADGRTCPSHVVLPPELTGVDAPIVVAFGNRFPMIGAHKVLAAYGCLAPRIVTGQFDPTAHRAIWPSTGNYCRGGVAISPDHGLPRRGGAARRG